MTKLRSIFILLHLAWIWLFLLIIHVLAVEWLKLEGVFFEAFSKVVYFSCFLLFPIAEVLNEAYLFWLFFLLQFSFWALVSLVNVYIFKKINS